MVQKRTFDEDELIEVSSKQLRQHEPERQLISLLKFPSESVVQNPNASGDNCSAKIKPGCDENFNFEYSESIFFPKKEIESKASSSLPCSFWATNNSLEEDIRLESPFHIISSPDFYNTERLPRTNLHHGEIYSFLLDHPPRKAVAVGPDFQANIPEWVETKNERTLRFSKDMNESSIITSQSVEYIPFELLGSEKELSGCCVIPMPESMLPADSWEVGVGGVGCSCVDVGSIRCVQLHILNAREKLEKTLGHEVFSELGFYDMGEVVADNWIEEEEQLFHEVVFSNPASSGKNFWDHLAVAFPSRTKKEIVSYYFNVFMLRKRSEQNRFNSLNIDSDDDEWQGSDNSSDNEVEIYENNSEVKSPLDPDRHVCFDKNMHAIDKDIGQTATVDLHLMNGGGSNVNVLETCPSKVLAKCSSNIITQISSTGHSHDTSGADIRSDVPSSDDADIAPRASMERRDDCRHWTRNSSGTNGTSHEFMLETCSARDWDAGYATCLRNEVDLLPTCSMIEEVFGAGSWNCKARDNQGLS